jgi:hypothetical protein
MMRRSSTTRTIVWALACGLAHAVGTGGVLATPLAPEICENLKGEIQSLEQGGLRATIARGPDAAKTTLTTEQLSRIRRLFDLDAQLKFRCPSDRAAALLKAVAPEDNPDAPGYSSETVVGGAVTPAKPKPKPAVPKEGVPKAAKAAAVEPSGNTAPTAAKPAPRAKATPKSDDAFRPPATGDVNGTPLQKQTPVRTIQP